MPHLVFPSSTFLFHSSKEELQSGGSLSGLIPFSFFHLVSRTPINQLSDNDFGPFFNRFSCFLLKSAESSSSSLQLMSSVIDLCPQLVESFFTSASNPLETFWERFHPSRNRKLNRKSAFEIKDNLFLLFINEVRRETHHT